MAKEKILVIEDDDEIRELLEYNLKKEGYTVLAAAQGEDGIKLANAKRPDLILLDLMLPGIDGFEVCKRLKREAKTELIPVIMLTAKGEESDVVAGLELGAADYITKPFSPRVVVARIRAVCRRREQEANPPLEQIRVHEIILDTGRHEVKVGSKLVQLTITEYRLLQFLIARPGWVFTRYQIVDGVKGEDYPVTERSVDVQIVGLRKKLGVAGKYIETVRGVGYRFKE